MKKLMILVACLAMGLVANAAKVTWTATNVSDGLGGTTYFAYLVDAASYATVGDAVSALQTSGVSATGVMYSQALTYNTSTKVAALAVAQKDITGTYAANADVSYYSLIFNAADAASATYYLSTTGDSAAVSKFSAASLLSAAQGSQAGKTWTAVPEPTSGLLLLLGMAGLALKRKRA